MSRKSPAVAPGTTHDARGQAPVRPPPGQPWRSSLPAGRPGSSPGGGNAAAGLARGEPPGCRADRPSRPLFVAFEKERPGASPPGLPAFPAGPLPGWPTQSIRAEARSKIFARTFDPIRRSSRKDDITIDTDAFEHDCRHTREMARPDRGVPGRGELSDGRDRKRGDGGKSPPSRPRDGRRGIARWRANRIIAEAAGPRIIAPWQEFPP